MYTTKMIRQGMNYTVLAGMLYGLYFVAWSGPVLSTMALAVKMSNFQLGVLFSLGSLLIPLQILGVFLQPRVTSRKTFWGVSFVLQVTAVLMIVPILYYISKGVLSSWYLIACIGLVHLFAQLPASLWVAWMGDLIPQEKSSQFWSYKNGVGQITGLVATLAVGFYFQRKSTEVVSSYYFILLIAVFFGYLTFLMQYRAIDPGFHRERYSLRSIFPTLTTLLRQKQFQRLLTIFGIHAVANGLIAPFVIVFLKNVIGYDMMQIQLFVALITVISFFSSYVQSILIERFRTRPVLALCAVVKVIEFILWGLFTKNNANYLIVPIALLAGFGNIGLLSAQFSLATRTQDKQTSGLAIGIFFSTIGILTFIFSVLGGGFYDLLEPGLSQVNKTPFHLYMFLSASLYLISLTFIKKFEESGASEFSDLIKWLTLSNPLRSLYDVYQLNQPHSEEEKVNRLRETATLSADKELLFQLYSPSSRIREQAIMTIAHLGEKTPLPIKKELLNIIFIPAYGVKPLIARTIGYTRYLPAVPMLVDGVESFDLSFSQSCIFSLGRMGDEASIQKLTQIATQESKREMWPFAAEALGKSGNFTHAFLLTKIYQQQYQSIIKKQTLIALTNLFLHKRDFYTTLELETTEGGSVVEKSYSSIRNILKKRKGEELFNQIHNVMGNSYVAYEKGDYRYSVALIASALSLFSRNEIGEYNSYEELEELLERNLEKESRKFPLKHTISDFSSAAYLTVKMFWGELKYNSFGNERDVHCSAVVIAKEVIDSKLK